MANYAMGDLDLVFKALADPTRRTVVEQLGSGPATTKTLAARHAMALPSFTQHLSVLERAGIVTSTKKGRVRTYRLQPERLIEAENWMARRRELWEKRLDQLDEYLLSMKEQQ
ncbi:MAG: ArsR/SmtB family transcription factor [Chloroflexota bacterium]